VVIGRLYVSAAVGRVDGGVPVVAAGNEFLIPIVAAIIGLGVGAQILSDRFEIPSIIFLIGAGIFLGPEGLGVVTRNSFGNALPAIVGLSVAIIVFEGAFHLRLDKLRETPSETTRLVTLGAAIALEDCICRLPWRVGGGLVQFCNAAGVGLVVSPITLVAARADLPYHRWLWSLSVVLYGWALFRVVHDVRYGLPAPPGHR